MQIQTEKCGVTVGLRNKRIHSIEDQMIKNSHFNYKYYVILIRVRFLLTQLRIILLQ